MHTVNLRVDSINDRHVQATLFMNGVNLGKLVFDIGEYQIFSSVLLMGAKATGGHIKDISDYSVFKEWANRKGD